MDKFNKCNNLFKVFSKSQNSQWPKTVDKSYLQIQMAKQFIITFFKKFPQKSQNSRPGETYQYLSLKSRFRIRDKFEGHLDKIVFQNYLEGLQKSTFFCWIFFAVFPQIFISGFVLILCCKLWIQNWFKNCQNLNPQRFPCRCCF